MSTPLTNHFGAYVPLSTTSTAQNKTDINAMLSAFAALFNQEGPSNNTTGTGNIPVYPEFQNVSPLAVALIIAEVNAMIANITNSP